MPGWLIGAAIGAGLSALQSAQANSDQKRAKRKYLEYLDKAKVSPLEEQKLVDATGDVYMGQTMDAMNSSVGMNQLYNRDTAMALIKGRGLAARAGAQVQQKSKIFDFNKSIDLKKAEAEAAMPDQGLDFGAIAAGGIAGAQTGMGIESSIEENKLLGKQQDFFDKMLNETKTKPFQLLGNIPSVYGSKGFMGNLALKETKSYNIAPEKLFGWKKKKQNLFTGFNF